MRSKIIYGLAIMGLIAVGCNDPDDGSYVDPVTIYEKMDGDWGLMSLKMVDEYAKANAIEPSEQNMGAYFNYEDFKIRFSVDDNMEPTTYEVMGDVPPLFPANGYWKLSSAFQQPNGEAVKIYLYSDAQKTQMTDELKLVAVPGSGEQMELQLVRKSGGIAFVSYSFKLNAVN